MHWITARQLALLAAENTDAHRVGTDHDGWIERFGTDYIVSATSQDAAHELAARLEEFAGSNALHVCRIFFRRLVKQPGETDIPSLLSGPGDLPSITTVTERGIRAAVDFSAGYSAGWFCDQRANRAWLESEIRPASLLNCFAYTGAFSLAAARCGAKTTNIDLSKKSLIRAKLNFELNAWDAGAHRFLTDDVFAVLPRLHRRGDRYDAVILDPPTFSRGAGGRVFRAEEHLGDLVALTLPLVNPGGWVLLSTNASTLDVYSLRELTQEIAPSVRIDEVSPPPEYPESSVSSTIWFQTSK